MTQKVNRIMSDLPILGRNSVEQQAVMFRLCERDYGLTTKSLSKLANIPLTTLKGWKNGTAMPAWGLFALADAGIPDHLISLVSGPFQRSVTTNSDDGDSLDLLAQIAADLAYHYAHARHPSSPGGTVIVPQEVPNLSDIADRLKAASRKAA
jgi:hypothetical protein